MEICRQLKYFDPLGSMLPGVILILCGFVCFYYGVCHVESYFALCPHVLSAV